MATSNRTETGADRRGLAFGALVITVTGWSLAPVLIRFLSTAYDPFTQGFVRYLCGSVALVTVCMLFFRSELLYALRNSWGLVALGLTNTASQTTWTIACYGADATVAQLVTKLNVIFVIVFSFVLFHEERAMIRNPIYLLGTLVSLVGVAAVLGEDPTSYLPSLNLYTGLLMLTALGWAVYAVWAKHIVKDVHPVPLFTVIALYSTLGLGIVALIFGRPSEALLVGPGIAAITIFSGVFSIATSHACYHVAQKRLGAAFCTSVNLINPFITFMFALLILPGEYLSGRQWAGACILIGGILAIVVAGEWTRRKTRARMEEAAHHIEA